MTNDLKFVAADTSVLYNGFWNTSTPQVVIGPSPYGKKVKLTGRSYDPGSFKVTKIDESAVKLKVLDKKSGVIWVEAIVHGKSTKITVVCGKAEANLIVHTRRPIYKSVNFFIVKDKSGKTHKDTAWVNDMHVNMNRIVFPQCLFFFMKGKVVAESIEWDLTDKSKASESDVIASFKSLAIKSGAATGSWNVFLVETYKLTDTTGKDVRGWNLGGGGPTKTGWCLVEDKKKSQSRFDEYAVLAHEAGHFLGAGHHNADDSLMHEFNGTPGTNRVKLYKVNYDQIIAAQPK